MDHNNDKLLVVRLKKGDKQAFEKLYLKYSPKLFNFGMLILYDKTLAKDIVQNCFLTVWEKHEQLDPDKNFSSYLYTITRNLIYKETERLILNARFTDTKENTEQIDNNTVESLNASFLEGHINKYLEALPRLSKQIFLLKKEEGLSNQDIHTTNCYKHLKMPVRMTIRTEEEPDAPMKPSSDTGLLVILLQMISMRMVV